MSDRPAIAETLGAVSFEWHGEPVQIIGHEYEPDTIATWQAWPVWLQTAWLTACIPEPTWHVIVVLPVGNTEAWSTAADAAIEPIRGAFDQGDVGNVALVEPVTLTPGDPGNSWPALRFTLTT